MDVTQCTTFTQTSGTECHHAAAAAQSVGQESKSGCTESQALVCAGPQKTRSCSGTAALCMYARPSVD